MAYHKPRKACGAKNRKGTPCQLGAGWGTDHAGQGRCKLHGGRSLAGRDSPTFKHGLYSKEISSEDEVEFEDFARNLDWLKPSPEEVYGLYRALRAICSPGSLPLIPLVQALKGIVGIKKDYQEIIEGKTVNVHFEDEQVRQFVERAVKVIADYVPADKRAEVIGQLRGIIA